MYKIFLNSVGCFSEIGPEIAGESPILSRLEMPALIVYEGTFESGTGTVKITKKDIHKLAETHNHKLVQMQTLYGDIIEKKCPPIQLDHSDSARDTIGRVVGTLTPQPYVNSEGKEVTGLYCNNLLILGSENVEKVLDGRWCDLSIGADLGIHELSETSVTPFPAAKGSSLLKKGEKMDKEEMIKKLLAKCKKYMKAKLSDEDQESYMEKCKKMLNGMKEDALEECMKEEDTLKKKLGDAKITIDSEDKKEMSDDDKDKKEMSEDEDKDKKEMSEDEDKDKKEMSEDEDKDKKEMSEDEKDKKEMQDKKEDDEKMSDKDCMKKMSDSEKEKYEKMEDSDEKKEYMKKMMEKYSEKKEMSDDEKDKKEMEDKDEKKEKLSAARESIANLSKGLKASSDEFQFKLKKTQLSSRVAKLRSAGKITPAEEKKIELNKLSKCSDETIDEVFTSYEKREPQIYAGLYGSAKAIDLAKVTKDAEMANLEAETRANMSLKKGTDKKKDGKIDTAAVLRLASKKENISLSHVLDLIDKGDKEAAKIALKGAYQVADSGEAFTKDSEVQLSALAESFKNLQNQFNEVLTTIDKLIKE